MRVVDLHGQAREEPADPAIGADPSQLTLLLGPGQNWDLTTNDGVRDLLASCAMELVTDRMARD